MGETNGRAASRAPALETPTLAALERRLGFRGAALHPLSSRNRPTPLQGEGGIHAVLSPPPSSLTRPRLPRTRRECVTPAAQGRPMKQWVAIPPRAKVDWLKLAREAFEFVGV
jgi:hypothetical protein